jgi:hypothetical protein
MFLRNVGWHRVQRTAPRHIPEVDNLHNHRCENLKSYLYMFSFSSFIDVLPLPILVDICQCVCILRRFLLIFLYCCFLWRAGAGGIVCIHVTCPCVSRAGAFTRDCVLYST